MTRPHSYLIKMFLLLGVVGAVCVILFLPMRSFFLANIALNGLIVGILLLGIIYNFRQVSRLYPEVAWIEEFRRSLDKDGSHPSVQKPVSNPQLLAPMAAMISNRNSLSLSAMSLRSLLDGIGARLDESRDLSRYTIGLLIFLGLLGTFWGLLETVGSISDVIGGLSVESGDSAAVFSSLKQGLETPLSGMATAFSSSLFGLAGSLVLGFLDLQAAQAQNRFYNDLEEWLSSVTRLSSGAIGGDGEQGVPAYVQALLEQTAESLENLQRTLARGEESRANADAGIHALANKIEILTDQRSKEQALIKSLAETQVAIKPILQQIADNAGPLGGGVDEATQAHIRNLDLHVGRMADELRSGRDSLVQQIRSEIKLLARTVAATNEDHDR
ncbi:MAG: flagellar motor protein MotA [Magnetovibrio sp.]|nr:flagellar motor protein MotA [Magnetovibrio sp.]